MWHRWAESLSAAKPRGKEYWLAPMFHWSLGSDLVLELLSPQHAGEIHALVDKNREHLRPWMPWADASQTLADTEAFVASTIQQFDTLQGMHAAILLRGRIVGVVGMNNINYTSNMASIGYWLDEQCQGQGIVTRACAVLLEHAFTELGLQRIEIRCAPQNTKSRAVPERLGFTQEGSVSELNAETNTTIEHIVYALQVRDWEARTGQGG